MERGEWEMRGEVRKRMDVPLQVSDKGTDLENQPLGSLILLLKVHRQLEW
jgi:hypothetical protein